MNDPLIKLLRPYLKDNRVSDPATSESLHRKNAVSLFTQRLLILLAAVAYFTLTALGGVIPALVVLVIVIPVLFVLFGTHHNARHFRKRLNSGGALETLEEDRRPCCVYFRAFDADKGHVSKWSSALTDEQKMALEATGIGPFIAIGKPGELAPPLGATRLYCKDEAWKEVASLFLDNSALILMRPGGSAGVEWELNQALDRDDLNKLTLVFFGDEFEQFTRKQHPLPALRDLPAQPSQSTHYLTCSNGTFTWSKTLPRSAQSPGNPGKPTPPPADPITDESTKGTSPALIIPITLVIAVGLVLTIKFGGGETGGTKGSAPGTQGSTEQVFPVPLPAEITPASPGSDFTNTLSQNLVWCPPGDFVMGNPENEYFNEYPHKVTLTQGFWIGRFEVTQAEWKNLNGENPSKHTSQGSNAPVENISSNHALEFCKKLTEREQRAGALPAGWKYSLPTESQWEYACRAGGAVSPTIGNIAESAWYDDNSENMTHPVGTKLANPWGLHDTQGNVSEWCMDWYATEYPSGPVVDPAGPPRERGSVVVLRTMRGGAYDTSAEECQPTERAARDYNYYDGSTGFRLAIVRTTE